MSGKKGKADSASLEECLGVGVRECAAQGRPYLVDSLCAVQYSIRTWLFLLPVAPSLFHHPPLPSTKPRLFDRDGRHNIQSSR